MDSDNSNSDSLSSEELEDSEAVNLNRAQSIKNSNTEPKKNDDVLFTQNIVNRDSQFKALRKELRLLQKRHPEVKLFQKREHDEKLDGMTLEELKEVVDNFKEDIGIAEPCAFGSIMCMFLGKTTELALGLNGFADHISKNTQLVSFMDGLLPSDYLEHGEKLKAVQAFLTEIITFKNKNAPTG